MKGWLKVRRGDVPVVVSMPHTGTAIPAETEAQLVSPWLSRKDTDWWVDDLYEFAHELGITTVRTMMSRTVIDVNRDPSGKSLYPGANTTSLCPVATFDNEALYLQGMGPDAGDVTQRLDNYFVPYHAAILSELERLGATHPRVVLYDAHSIRSRIPHLFDGELPQFNIGTNDGESCDAELTAAVEAACAQSEFSSVTNGRFKGGWITRYYGEPARGVHAIQMELACRGYMQEPEIVSHDNWPTPYEPARAAPLRAALRQVLAACITFARVETSE
jgi:N-formylglutamate deformylase